jgi:phage terminase large subunit-like protein
MSKRNYRGHSPALIDKWFAQDEQLDRYNSKLYYFDEQAAQLVLDFFQTFCTHVEGEWAGKPLIPEQWEYRVIRDLFGWKRIQDGCRKYRTVYIEVPRKNGKTTLGAGVGLYLTLADHEPGAKVFSAATDKDQAAISFEIAKQMVQGSPELSRRCQVFKSTIYVPQGGSVYRVLSAAPKKSGLNAHGLIFDELHEQPDRKLWDILHTSTAARRQPVTWAMTTAGYDQTTICWEIHERAIRVRDGVFDDPSLLPVIFAAEEKDDWTAEETWRKANPNFGISVKAEFLRTECKTAQEVPAYQNTFKRLHLNIWTRQIELWMPREKWELCGEAFPLEPLGGEECFAGLDLSSITDLSAFARLWPVWDEGDGEAGAFHFFADVHFWLPRENLHKKEDLDGVPYGVWAERGFITLTEGDIIDYDVIRAHIAKAEEFAPMKELAYDRWNACQIVTQLTGDALTMVPFGQGFASMAQPTKDLMALVLKKRLHHGSNPVLDWMASNVTVRSDPAGNWKPDKAKSTKRIDGIVALIMALGRATLNLEGGSAYDNHGVLTI